MKPWWQVATPHKDIREGKFDEAVFAANLGDVLRGNAPFDYQDPQTFFDKTHLTDGLKTILGSVLRRLAGGKGDAVIQLQTPFGGGKTHSLLALYHIVKHSKELSSSERAKHMLKEINIKSIPQAQTAVFVGTEADPLKGKTPWGEMATQLGVYDLFKEHDSKRVAPGKELLSKMIEKCGSVLVLMDEVLEYAVKAAQVESVNRIAKGQLLAFIQELTEVISTSKDSVLVLTLPSSALEQYDENAEKTLAQLQKVSGRVETIYAPVEGEEIYEIIRKRLFEDLGDSKTHQLVASKYVEMYQALGEDIIPAAKETTYREKIKKAYPFHPELIDILHERWGTITTFQRTRGVLRLLAEVVSDLYSREDSSPLIQPSSINLANPTIKREFIKHIENVYESVLTSDIVGAGAKAPAIDKDMGTEYSKFKIAASLATSVFLYSFSGSEKKGTSLQRLRLAFLREGIPPAIVGDAAKRLEEELWYLHVDKSVYSFRSQPNLNRVIIDKEETVKDDQLEKEIEAQIRNLAGTEMEVLLWPKASNDIPDNKRLKLAIMPIHLAYKQPETEKFVSELLTKYSQGFRTYKNALVFLVVDGDEVDPLKRATRRLLALRHIKEDKETIESLMEENKKVLAEKLKDAESAVPQRILSAYRYLAKGSSDSPEFLDMGIPTVGEASSLSARVKSYLKEEERMLDKISSKYVVEKTFAKDDEKKTVESIWDAFLKFPELPILEAEDTLKASIAEGVRLKTLGLAYNDEIFYGDNISVSEVLNDAHVVKKDIAKNLKAEKAEEEGEEEELGEQGEEEEEGVAVGTRPGTIKIRVKVPWDKLSEFTSGVLGPLQQEGATTHLEIDLTVEAEKGIDPNVLELKVKETLSQINADILEWKQE